MYLYVIIHVLYKLQVVVDADLMLRDIYTGWPGSTHDARVLRIQISLTMQLLDSTLM